MLKLEDLPLVPETTDPVDVRIINTVESIQFVFVCFTVPFYTTILFYLIVAQFQRIDELCTPFFKLCITTAIIDLFTLFTNYFGAMFPKWGWYLKLYLFLDNFYIRPYFFLAWFSGVAQAMSVSIMATNRLSAIIFPNLHYSYWSPSRMRIAYSLQFIPGILMGFCTYLSPAQLYRSQKNGIVPKLVDETMTFYLFGLCGVFMFFVCTYLVIAYCYLFYILRKSSLAMKKATSSFTKMRNRIRKREAKLFIMSTITVAIQITVLFFLIIYNFSIVVIEIEKFYLFYNAISDIYSGINPYLLWIFSDVLRKYILQELGVKKTKKQTTHSHFAGGNSVITIL